MSTIPQWGQFAWGSSGWGVIITPSTNPTSINISGATVTPTILIGTHTSYPTTIITSASTLAL